MKNISIERIDILNSQFRSLTNCDSRLWLINYLSEKYIKNLNCGPCWTHPGASSDHCCLIDALSICFAHCQVYDKVKK